MKKKKPILGPDPGAVPGSKIEPIPGKPGWFTETWGERDNVTPEQKEKWTESFNSILSSLDASEPKAGPSKELKWIDVNDRVPENSNSVLVWCENKWSVACYFRHKEYVDYPGDELDDDQIDNMFDSDGKTETYWLKEGWYESLEDRYGDFFFWQRIVTHWMPLPEPPIV